MFLAASFCFGLLISAQRVMMKGESGHTGCSDCTSDSHKSRAQSKASK